MYRSSTSAPGSSSEPDVLTCIVSPVPDDAAAIAARLGRLSAEDAARLGDRRLDELSLDRRAQANRGQRAGPASVLGRAPRSARSVGPRTLRPDGAPGARRRERAGRPRRPAGGARRGCRRARPVVLRRSAPAPGARSRPRRRPGDPRAGRADQRGRRAHRGADRPRSPRVAERSDDRDRVDEPARPRSGRSSRVRPRRSRGIGWGRTASCSAPTRRTGTRSRAGRRNERPAPHRRRPGAQGARTHPGTAAPGPPDRRRRAARVGCGSRARRAGAARLARPVRRGRDDALAHRHRRPRARGLHRSPDDPHLVRAARVVRPLGPMFTDCARTSCARFGTAALDRRTGGDRGSHLAHDRRSRVTRSHRSLRDSGDADRRGHHDPHRRRGDLGQPVRRAVARRRRAGALDRHALVPATRPAGVPLGARWLREARGERRGDGRRRAHDRGARLDERRIVRFDDELRDAYPGGAVHAPPPDVLVPDGRDLVRPARCRRVALGRLAGAVRSRVDRRGDRHRPVRAAARRPCRPARLMARRDPGRSRVARTARRHLVRAARPDRLRPGARRPGADCRDVRYAYVADRDVLHGIDLDLRPGERVAVVGPSGAGKSTLGRLLAGIHPPRTGKVEVGGVRLVELPLEPCAGRSR